MPHFHPHGPHFQAARLTVSWPRPCPFCGEMLGSVTERNVHLALYRLRSRPRCVVLRGPDADWTPAQFLAWRELAEGRVPG